MADKTVRYVAGNYIEPNIDSDKTTPNQDPNASNLANTVILTQVLNQVKNTGVQVVTRRAQRAGNSSQAENIQKIVSGVSDAGIIYGGFKTGGLKGAALATAYVGVQKFLEYDEIQFGYAVDDLEAREEARRRGMQVNDRGGFR